MTISPVNGFQAVDNMFASIPKTVSWTKTDTERLVQLFTRGKELQLEEGIVNMMFKMNKPFDENDDEIDNMLNWEAYRVDFQATSESHLSLKKEEADLQRDMLSFMSENLLCFTFAIMEMKSRLVEPYEVFHTFKDTDAVSSRIDELTGILTGENLEQAGSQGNLREKFYGVG